MMRLRNWIGGRGRRIVASVVIRLAFTGASFLITVFAARLIGADGYGAYAFVLALASFLAIPMEFGLPALVVREVATAEARTDRATRRGIVRFAFAFLGLASVTVLIGALLMLELWRGAPAVPAGTYVWGLVLAPLVALGMVQGSILRGMGHVLTGQLPQVLLRPLLFCGLLLAVFLFGRSWHVDAARVMALHVIAAAATVVVGSVLLRAAVPTPDRSIQPRLRARAWLTAMLPLGLSDGIQAINRYADILVIGILLGAAEAGPYRGAVQFSILVSLGLQAVNMIVAPRLARLHAQGEHRRLEDLVRSSALAATALGAPVFVILFTLGGPILRLTLGQDFADAAVPLAILVVGQLANVAMGPIALLLNMSGHERATARGVSVAAIANLALNFALVPVLGLTGAALATATSVVIWNVVLWRYANRVLGITWGLRRSKRTEEGILDRA